MKAWTHRVSSDSHPYWVGTGDAPIICVQPDNGPDEWRRVDTGEILYGMGKPHPWHRAKLLDPKYHPQWYRDLDVYGVDEGL